MPPAGLERCDGSATLGLHSLRKATSISRTVTAAIMAHDLIGRQRKSRAKMAFAAYLGIGFHK